MQKLGFFVVLVGLLALVSAQDWQQLLDTDFYVDGDTGLAIQLQPSGFDSTFELEITSLREINNDGNGYGQAAFLAPTVSDAFETEEYTGQNVTIPFTIIDGSGASGELFYELRVYGDDALIQWGEDEVKVNGGALKSILSLDWDADAEATRFEVNATLSWDIDEADVAKCIGDAILSGNPDLNVKHGFIEDDEGNRIGYEVDACLKVSVEFPGKAIVDGDQFQDLDFDIDSPDIGQSGSVDVSVTFAMPASCSSGCSIGIDPVFEAQGDASTLIRFSLALVLACLFLALFL